MDNVNIWDESPEGTLSFDADGNIKYATLNKLIELISSNNTGILIFKKYFWIKIFI